MNDREIPRKDNYLPAPKKKFFRAKGCCDLVFFFLFFFFLFFSYSAFPTVHPRRAEKRGCDGCGARRGLAR